MVIGWAGDWSVVHQHQWWCPTSPSCQPEPLVPLNISPVSHYLVSTLDRLSWLTYLAPKLVSYPLQGFLPLSSNLVRNFFLSFHGSGFMTFVVFTRGPVCRQSLFCLEHLIAVLTPACVGHLEWCFSCRSVYKPAQFREDEVGVPILARKCNVVLIRGMCCVKYIVKIIQLANLVKWNETKLNGPDQVLISNLADSLLKLLLVFLPLKILTIADSNTAYSQHWNV